MEAAAPLEEFSKVSVCIKLEKRFFLVWDQPDGAAGGRVGCYVTACLLLLCQSGGKGSFDTMKLSLFFDLCFHHSRFSDV